MSAAGFLVALAVAYVIGWFTCSYLEQEARSAARKDTDR